jgi:hypothetical protein
MNFLNEFYSLLDKWELLILLTVAILEIYILVHAKKEKKEREILIRQLESTRIELGRESYLVLIKEGLKNAKRYLYFTSHTLTSTMDSKQKDEMFSLYKKIDHRLIAGKDVSKIKFMLEQQRKGVNVRVNDLILISSFRFQVSDDNTAILGFSKDGNNSSRKGIKITDAFFCKAQKEHFINLWDQSEALNIFIKKTLEKFKNDNLENILDEFILEWELTEDEKIIIGFN